MNHHPARMGGKKQRKSLAAPARAAHHRPGSRLFEQLEGRALLAADPWHNAANPADVNNDGAVSPFDVALLVSDLKNFGSRQLLASAASLAASTSSTAAASAPTVSGSSFASALSTAAPANTSGTFLDVTGDGAITPLDLATVVNALATQQSGAFTLKTTDTSGNPISTIAVGQTFNLQGYVQDTSTPNPQGFFTAYMNIAYSGANNAVLASIPSNTTVTYNSSFDLRRSANFFTNTISDIGASHSGTPPSDGGNPTLLFTVPVTATASGTLTFQSSFVADSQNFPDVIFLPAPGQPVTLTMPEVTPGSVSIQITGTGPTAVADSASVATGSNVAISVLTNDTDSAGTIDPTTVAIGTQPTHGTAVVNAATGVVTYTPTGSFTGPDSFTYTVKDTNGNVSNAATVSLTITSAPVAPVAVNDSAQVPENSFATISILANDTKGTGNIVANSVVATQPSHGTVTVDAAGVATYTPTTNYKGPDSFTYTVKDSNGLTSNVATVSLTVLELPPTAVNDSGQTSENAATTINLLANDTKGTGNIVASSVVATQPAHGTVTVDALGVATYTPNNNYLGPDSFTYKVSDDLGGVSNSATVSLTVTPIPPVANNDTGSVLENGTTAINVASNDTASFTTIAPATVTITIAPAHGIATVNADGTIQYTPNSEYFGSDTLSYKVKDTNGTTSNVASVAITVTFVHQPPLAVNDTVNTGKATPVTVSELLNDSAEDGTLVPTSVAIVTAPTNGTAVVNADGTITYTPAADFLGTDQLQYTVQDNQGFTSNTATISFQVGNNAILAGFAFVKQTPLSGAPINLQGTDTLGNPISRTTVTGADGSYSFTLLPPGHYVLSEGALGSFYAGTAVGSGGSTITVDLAAGANSQGNNFTSSGLKGQLYGPRSNLASSGQQALAVDQAMNAQSVWIN